MKKSKTYSSKSALPTVFEEAAVQYEPMKVLLGGARIIKENITSENDLIALVRSGIKKGSLKALAACLGITMDEMSSIIHTSHRNIQRKQDDALLDPLKSEKVVELALLAQKGIAILGTQESFREWLHTPLLALGHSKPVTFLDTSMGIHMVKQVLGRLEQGVYS